MAHQDYRVCILDPEVASDYLARKRKRHDSVYVGSIPTTPTKFSMKWQIDEDHTPRCRELEDRADLESVDRIGGGSSPPRGTKGVATR